MGIDDFESGGLPGVCVKTGVPTDLRVTMRFTPLSTWMWWLLLLGLLPFVIAYLISSSDAASGRVPLAPRVYLGQTRARLVRATAFTLGVVGLMGAVLLSRVLLWPALVLLGVAAAALLREWSDGPRARIDRTRGVVWLYGVHPGFAAAVNRRAAENNCG